MEIQESHHSWHESWSETDSNPGSNRVGYSGPLSGPITSNSKKNSSKKNSARFKDDERYVEITLDIQDDSVSVQNIRGGGSDTAYLASRLERKASSSSLGSQLSFKLRQVSRELKRMTSSKTFNKVDRSKSGAARALKGLQFMSSNKNIGSEGWSQVELRFDELAVNGMLPKSSFGQCIGMNESKEFASELFDALARRRGINSDSITKAQLQGFWEQITDQSFDARLQTFFDMVDKNLDGRITEKEVKEIILLSASANKLSKIQESAEEYAALIMEELDPDNLGYVELYNLEMLLLQAPNQSTNLITDSRMLSQMLSLFTWKFIQYKNRAVFDVMGYCVTTAKGAAETLKFNMALILLPVCRNTITLLRSKTKLGAVVPFDDNINFHKVVAFGIAIGVGLHAIAHLTCDFPRLLHTTDDEYEPMEQFFGEDRPENYWWFVKGTEGWTGVVMVVLMAIAYILAQPWFRRNRLKRPKFLKKLTGFNAFWYSHHLFVIVYVLFIVHGYYLFLSKKWYKKTTWMYLAVPVLLYACERLIRAFRSGYKSVKILKVAVYPGNVLALHMSKPQGFKYTSGQYIFVNCADVSPFQWHPFSITSAPGDDYLSIHIRTLGDWTSQLKTLFSKVCQPPSMNQSGLLRADVGDSENKPRLPKLLIDGAYGAPAQDYKEYDVLLLVGLGIGATPLISIVKDVLNNIRQQKGIGRRNSRGGVMNEVADYDLDGIIELHNYCTSVYEEGDARSALITMLQSLNHAKNGLDIVSGVFYCGAPGLTGELRRLAQDFSRKTTTKFDFHKENF
ncbi:hypothetical protein Patl1_22531 [Pistacia atlantica]|uniref:Uncharacterized protein n=1 Tax=Pistacia atlantica TaxID=434234 RepID=A0ACC0ZZ01_9ROSI|nr:hypothetical protein Patl1_22531 [Pistacia atlantica]